MPQPVRCRERTAYLLTLDLDGVTKLKVGDRLYKRLKVTGMNNLHAGAFDSYLDTN